METPRYSVDTILRTYSQTLNPLLGQHRRGGLAAEGGLGISDDEECAVWAKRRGSAWVSVGLAACMRGCVAVYAVAVELLSSLAALGTDLTCFYRRGNVSRNLPF